MSQEHAKSKIARAWTGDRAGRERIKNGALPGRFVWNAKCLIYMRARVYLCVCVCASVYVNIKYYTHIILYVHAYVHNVYNMRTYAYKRNH